MSTNNTNPLNNKYLEKVAEMMSADNKKDIVDTGVIGLMGGVTSTLADSIVHGKPGFNPRMFAIGTGLGLAGDYAALKINKVINKRIDSANKA